MRTLLLGTDFAYKQNGDLIPIEINTNVGWDESNRIEETPDCFNISELVNFIETNGFTKIDYIGAIGPFFNKLKASVSVECEYHTVTTGVVIPYIEDTDTTLIIRSAYDTTALVDDTYCINKINFLELIKNETFGSEFAYMNSNGELINNITTILDNGNQPNFILKAVGPHYDKDIYPKLFKVSNQTELDIVLQNVNQYYFLMPFYYNENQLYNRHISVVRSLNLLFPPNLESITIGQYHKICDNKILDNPSFDPVTFQYTGEKERYIAEGLYPSIIEPKLENDDFVMMADGTYKTALDLQIGDEIKTIDIPNPFDVIKQDEVVNYLIDFPTFQSGTTYSINKVTDKKAIHKLVGVVEITFTDNSTWSDTLSSNYLIKREGEIRFLPIRKLKEGDTIVLVDTSDLSTPSFVEKIISSISNIDRFIEGWVISVEREHLFLTSPDPALNASFVAIEHNAPGDYCYCYRYYDCYVCNSAVCGKGAACGPQYYDYSYNMTGYGYCYGC
jgi:hypothetical protein